MGARGELRLVAPDGKPNTEGTAAALAKPSAPVKPKDLAAEISELWDEIITPLDEAGMVSGMDAPTLVLALEHYWVARQAANDLRENGLKTWDEKNQREARNPSQMIFSASTENFLKLANQLGLSFVSRARINIAAEKAGNDDNPFAG